MMEREKKRIKKSFAYEQIHGYRSNFVFFLQVLMWMFFRLKYTKLSNFCISNLIKL